MEYIECKEDELLWRSWRVQDKIDIVDTFSGII
jgi:hypothetical protein